MRHIIQDFKVGMIILKDNLVGRGTLKRICIGMENCLREISVTTTDKTGGADLQDG